MPDVCCNGIVDFFGNETCNGCQILIVKCVVCDIGGYVYAEDRRREN